MNRILWWLCLFVAPAVLIALELFHPANFTGHPGMYQYLSHAQQHDAQYRALGYFGPDWWFTLHMIQTPMVGLVAIGLWLMVGSIGSRDGTPAMIAAWLARATVFIFVVYYTILDSIAGINLGRTIVVLQDMAADGRLSPAQFDGVVLLLDTLWSDRFVGGFGSLISHIGSWAALAASIFIAAALLLSRRAGLPTWR